MTEPTIIRTSDRMYFKRCRELWNFTSKIRENWEPVQRYPAFDFGTAIHAGLQAYYEPSTWGQKALMRTNAMDAFYASLSTLHQLVKMGDLEFEVRFDDEYEMGHRMLDYYFLWAPKVDNFVPLYVEIEFEVPIPGLEGLAVYQGRIDLIVEVFDEEGQSLGYWLIDHKTASQFGDTQWLWLDDQCSSYAWAIREQLGLEVRGVIYNQLRKKPPHPPNMLRSGSFSVNKQQDTTFEVYLRAIRQAGQNPSWYRDFLLYLKKNPKEFCRRTKVKYNERQLQIVGERIRREAIEMINDPVIYPSPSPMNCNGCRFFSPCLQVQEGSEPYMEENYERRNS